MTHTLTFLTLHGGVITDAGGAPIAPLDRQLDEAYRPVDFEEQASTAGSSGEDESSRRASQEGQSSDPPTCGTSSEALFLLLCCTDSLRLYATHAVIQVSWNGRLVSFSLSTS